MKPWNEPQWGWDRRSLRTKDGSSLLAFAGTSAGRAQRGRRGTFPSKVLPMDSILPDREPKKFLSGKINRREITKMHNT